MEDIEEYSDAKYDDDGEECTVPFSGTIKELLDGIIWKLDLVKDREEEWINTGFREYTGPSGLIDGISDFLVIPQHVMLLLVASLVIVCRV